jgi:hypothetical protein
VDNRENVKEDVKAKVEKPVLDEFAVQIFSSLGVNEPSDDLVKTYLKLKSLKDKLVPGRLSAEGFAFCVMLSDKGRK